MRIYIYLFIFFAHTTQKFHCRIIQGKITDYDNNMQSVHKFLCPFEEKENKQKNSAMKSSFILSTKSNLYMEMCVESVNVDNRFHFETRLSNAILYIIVVDNSGKKTVIKFSHLRFFFSKGSTRKKLKSINLSNAIVGHCWFINICYWQTSFFVATHFLIKLNKMQYLYLNGATTQIPLKMCVFRLRDSVSLSIDFRDKCLIYGPMNSIKKKKHITTIVRRLFIYYNVNLTRRRKIDHRFFRRSSEHKQQNTPAGLWTNERVRSLLCVVVSFTATVSLASFSPSFCHTERGHWST